MKKEASFILGYDLSDSYCQISYFDSEKQEPETLEVAADQYQIPLVLGYAKGEWSYGKEAKRRSVIGECELIEDLYYKALHREKVKLGKKSYDGIRLLSKFIELSLESFEKITYLTFTMPEMNVDLAKMLKSITGHLGIPKEKVSAQDYKESFCYYMFYQPKELWQYESALFYCDEETIKAYMLRKLNVPRKRDQRMYVAVDEVASAKMWEWKVLSPVLKNQELAENPDESFKALIQNVFEKKVVSSVYLTGEGFEKNWYPNSQKVLCNGRRAFKGNNLYSRGACYMSYYQSMEKQHPAVYLDESKLMKKISLHMRVEGKEGWYPIVSWGQCWYEADDQWEMLLEDTSDVEIHIESLTGEELQVERISLEGLPDRRDYSLRVRLELMFLDESHLRITIRDVGFGEFFASTGFSVTKEIDLGGIHGQLYSMS